MHKSKFPFMTLLESSYFTWSRPLTECAVIVNILNGEYIRYFHPLIDFIYTKIDVEKRFFIECFTKTCLAHEISSSLGGPLSHKLSANKKSMQRIKSSKIKSCVR